MATFYSDAILPISCQIQASNCSNVNSGAIGWNQVSLWFCRVCERQISHFLQRQKWSLFYDCLSANVICLIYILKKSGQDVCLLLLLCCAAAGHRLGKSENDCKNVRVLSYDADTRSVCRALRCPSGICIDSSFIPQGRPQGREIPAISCVVSYFSRSASPAHLAQTWIIADFNQAKQWLL